MAGGSCSLASGRQRQLARDPVYCWCLPLRQPARPKSCGRLALRSHHSPGPAACSRVHAGVQMEQWDRRLSCLQATWQEPLGRGSPELTSDGLGDSHRPRRARRPPPPLGRPLAASAPSSTALARPGQRIPRRQLLFSPQSQLTLLPVPGAPVLVSPRPAEPTTPPGRSFCTPCCCPLALIAAV